MDILDVVKRAQFAVLGVNALADNEEAAFSQRTAFMPHEERAHIYRICALQTAANSIESAIATLTRLGGETIVTATPAPVYGHHQGLPLAAPNAYKIVPEGELIPQGGWTRKFHLIEGKGLWSAPYLQRLATERAEVNRDGEVIDLVFVTAKVS